MTTRKAFFFFFLPPNLVTRNESHEYLNEELLPHDPGLVFCKPFLHFISMVPLVRLHGLVAVLIELFSSLIDGSHVSGLRSVE